MELLLVFPKRVNRAVRALINKYLKDARLKSNHLLLIKGIGDSDGISQRDLGVIVPFDKSYISTTVHELMDMGLVFNEGDGKVHCLKLTDSGRDVWVLTNVMFDNFESRFSEVLTDEDRVALATAMTKISDFLDQVAEEGAEK